MFSNYLKVAIRNLTKHKAYSFINIVGLAIGITGSLLILVYVANQLSYESMHENRGHIYRASVEFGSGQSTIKMAGAFPALGPAAAAEIPDVIAAVRLKNVPNAIMTVGNKQFKEEHFFFADSNIFSVFTFPLLRGNKNTALADPTSLVISEKTAKKYFGDSDPMGKSMFFNGTHEFIITAVMKDVPPTTMIRCELIAPYSRGMEIDRPSLPWMQWGEDFTYFYLKEGVSIPHLQKQLRELYTRHTNPTMGALMNFTLLPLSDIYFKSDAMGELEPTGNLTSLYLFSSIAILVLLIACLNFVNLSTARSMRRAKEVGLRKVLGAHRGKLIMQFFGESLLITLFAVLLSLILFELFNPLLYDYFNIQLPESSFLSLKFYGVLTSTLLFVSLIAGVYPAVFLSKFQPVDSLKGTHVTGIAGSGLRRLLVTSQFAITTFLIIGTTTIYKQLNFMRHSDLGFDKANVLTVQYPISDKGMAEKYPVIKQAFQSVPGVVDVSGSYTLPGINSKETQSVQLKGHTGKDFSMLQAIGVDYSFIPTLGLKTVQGRNFSEQLSSDRDASIILNETAVQELGLTNPIGTEVYLPAPDNQHRLATIIGVVRDFHITSFRKKIEPIFLYINPARYYNIALKVDSRNTAGITAALKAQWLRVLPDKEFDCSPLDQTYESLYRSDERTASLFSLFSSLSIFIACMGLGGLVS